MHGLSLAAVSRGYFSLPFTSFSLWWLLLWDSAVAVGGPGIADMGSRVRGLRRGGAGA